MNSRLPKLSVGLPLFGGLEYLKAPSGAGLSKILMLSS